MWGFPFHRPSVDEQIEKQIIKLVSARGQLLTTAEIMSCYGKPGDPDNLITITTPYPFRIAWQPSEQTTRISCHKKVAGRLIVVFDDLLFHYGLVSIQRLGIDLFGGCYNFRPQRGLEKKYAAAIAAKNYLLAYTYLSRHSWAAALDLDPDRNSLKTKWKDAQFSKPEYKFMVDTFYKHGFIGYGIERNNDGMHFEIGLLL